ncbi:hypothetical protein MMC31_007817 [Peltigera leucophlebia]|nr:hypothetical protein [Peltigera leucophlebia]
MWSREVIYELVIQHLARLEFKVFLGRISETPGLLWIPTGAVLSATPSTSRKKFRLGNSHLEHLESIVMEFNADGVPEEESHLIQVTARFGIYLGGAAAGRTQSAPGLPHELKALLSSQHGANKAARMMTKAGFLTQFSKQPAGINGRERLK